MRQLTIPIPRPHGQEQLSINGLKKDDEPYYPVNDNKNNSLYEKYQKLAKKESKVIFGGRLGEYKYYDMDKVIAKALSDTSETTK